LLWVSAFASFCEHIFTSSLRRHPSKKYISKNRKILDREKVSSKHHDLPRNSPQLHHELPSKNTTKTQNPPVKTALHHKNIFSDSQPENPSG
jgi:hypothetical protein